jgi:hypothetical protein
MTRFLLGGAVAAFVCVTMASAAVTLAGLHHEMAQDRGSFIFSTSVEEPVPATKPAPGPAAPMAVALWSLGLVTAPLR